MSWFCRNIEENTRKKSTWNPLPRKRNFCLFKSKIFPKKEGGINTEEGYWARKDLKIYVTCQNLWTEPDRTGLVEFMNRSEPDRWNLWTGPDPTGKICEPNRTEPVKSMNRTGPDRRSGSYFFLWTGPEMNPFGVRSERWPPLIKNNYCEMIKHLCLVR